MRFIVLSAIAGSFGGEYIAHDQRWALVIFITAVVLWANEAYLPERAA